MTTSDRRIHATLEDGCQLVRYERAGKWYIECPGSPTVPAYRSQVTFGQAVGFASSRNSQVYLGLPGGTRFDKALKRIWVTS